MSIYAFLDIYLIDLTFSQAISIKLNVSPEFILPGLRDKIILYYQTQKTDTYIELIEDVLSLPFPYFKISSIGKEIKNIKTFL